MPLVARRLGISSRAALTSAIFSDIRRFYPQPKKKKILAAPFIAPIDIQSLWAMKLTQLQYVPRRAITAAAFALTHALTSSKWWMVLAFARLVLSRPLPGTRVVEAVKRRAKDFARQGPCRRDASPKPCREDARQAPDSPR